MKHDVDAIKRNNPIEEVISRAVDLRSKGNEFEGLCPFHDEKTPSFQVNPNAQLFHCKGCGAGGDVIKFVEMFNNITFVEACEQLGSEVTLDANFERRERKAPVDFYQGFEPFKVAPEEILGDTVKILNPKKVEEYGYTPKKWNIKAAWAYTNQDGTVSHYVVRSEIPQEGGKTQKLTPAVYWCKWPDGSEGWTLYKKKENNILFNLHSIMKNPDAIVCLCEGEKAAQMGISEALHLSEKYVFSCWPGGTNGASSVDWRPLIGRKVLLLPDYDPVGFKAMRGYYRNNDKSKRVKGVAEYLEEIGAEVVGCVIPPDDMPKGWDIADKDGEKEPAWQQGELINFIEKRKRKNIQKHPLEVSKSSDEGVDSNSSEQPEEWPEFRQPPEIDDYKEIDLSDAPFRILGYSKDTRYYLPNSTQQIIELSPSAHTKNQLINLAPLEYWAWKFGNMQGAKKIDWLEVANTLLKLSAQKGLFDTNTGIRGRGAWLDDGRAILHLGEQVFVDGDEFAPEDVDSKYIYEKNYSLGHVFEDPATDEEAKQLLEICQAFNWENPLSAQLLAGWCVCASVCGILDWRPHIWVTGASGSGKSTIVNNVINPLLGNFVIKTEGKTTEAGIRQTLGQDARSVIFDEAEAEDKRSAARLQEILDLARVSSSGGVITKGSQDGSGVTFCVRACFCFSAINHSVKHLADENRISQLVVTPNVDFNKEDFQALMIRIQETITEEYSAKMFARAMDNINTLRHNIKVFRDAATVILGSARTADQIGSMLAGAYLCQYDSKIEPEQAREWIKAQNWGDHTTLNSSSDLERLISKIATTRINVHYEHERFNITIGEAIVSASGRAKPESQLDKMSAEAHDELRRLGFKIYEPEAGQEYSESVLVANSCEPIRKILDDSPWSAAWSRTLSEHKQSVKVDTTYFSPGIRQRAVMLPVDAFIR